MSNSSTDDSESITGINVTPLVDISLVLLIIFMATAHLIVHRSVTLHLPKAVNAEQVPSQSIQILMEADKSLRLNDRPVTVQDLSVNLGQRSHLDPNLKVTLSADERVSWGDVAGVLDLLRGAGITHIATEMEPKKA